MIEHYEDKNRNTFFSQLINLKQKGSMVDHIEDFQNFNIGVIDIPEEHMIFVFIGTLKDNLQHEVPPLGQFTGGFIQGGKKSWKQNYANKEVYHSQL